MKEKTSQLSRQRRSIYKNTAVMRLTLSDHAAWQRGLRSPPNHVSGPIKYPSSGLLYRSGLDSIVADSIHWRLV